MHSGYLVVETNDAHPGLVRLYTAKTIPSLPAETLLPANAIPRHVARFNDLSTARMHAHELLRHRAVDAAAGLYRSTPIEAAAAIESIALRQQRAYLDPALAADPALEQMIAERRARRLRNDRAWRIIGALAVLFLILKLLLGF